ncbi:hypothetical protein [Actinoplanes sp. NPDC049599]|uniref:hypothetical protein n=1 Tax=Actinoplanes sp. NPDC049599 TaxID=3363903 RepID=UPI0037A52C89
MADRFRRDPAYGGPCLIHNRDHVWLDSKVRPDWSNQRRLKPTDDRVAFVIENAASVHALDPGHVAADHQGADPHVWSTHWEPYQQWMIVRLPLA